MTDENQETYVLSVAFKTEEDTLAFVNSLDGSIELSMSPLNDATDEVLKSI